MWDILNGGRNLEILELFDFDDYHNVTHFIKELLTIQTNLRAIVFVADEKKFVKFLSDINKGLKGLKMAGLRRDELQFRFCTFREGRYSERNYFDKNDIVKAGKEMIKILCMLDIKDFIVDFTFSDVFVFGRDGNENEKNVVTEIMKEWENENVALRMYRGKSWSEKFSQIVIANVANPINDGYRVGGIFVN